MLLLIQLPLLVQGSINYYCQAKFYRHLQNVCLDGLQKHGGDPVLMFWKAFGILMEGLYVCLKLQICSVMSSLSKLEACIIYNKLFL